MKTPLLAYIEAVFNPQMRAVLKDPQHIAVVERPSRLMQIAAVQKQPSAFMLIDNPCLKAQELAVRAAPFILKFIKNPSQKLQLLAVKAAPSSIACISSPCEKAQFLAIDKNLRYLRFINNPSKEVQLYAIKKDSNAIRMIKHPCKEAVSTVSAQAPELLKEIDLSHLMAAQMKESLHLKDDFHLNNIMTLSSGKFQNIKLSDSALFTLYKQELKELNSRYIGSLLKDQERTDNMLKAFCNERSLAEDLQKEIISDRPGSIQHFKNPSPDILSEVLLLTTGNKVTDAGKLEKIKDSIVNLVRDIETAYLDSQRPLSSHIIGFYEDQGKPYDEIRILQERLEKDLEKIYSRFRTETGMDLFPREHDQANKAKNSHPSGNPSREKYQDIYKTCNTVMKNLNKKLRAEANLNKELEKSGLQNLKLSKEQKETLLKKGGVALDGGKKIIQRIKTPVGYTIRSYDTMNNFTRQGQAEI